MSEHYQNGIKKAQQEIANNYPMLAENAADSDNLRGPEGVVVHNGDWVIYKVKTAGIGYEFEVRNPKFNVYRGPYFSVEEAKKNMHF